MTAEAIIYLPIMDKRAKRLGLILWAAAATFTPSALELFPSSMSQPPHQIWNDWNSYIHEDFHTTKAGNQTNFQDPMGMLPLYPHPRNLAPTTISSKSASLRCSSAHDDGLKFALIPVDFDTEFGGQQLMLAEEASNHPPGTLDALDVLGGQDIVEQTDSCINPASVFGAGSALTVTENERIATANLPATKRPLAPSRSRKSSQARHVCAVCSRSFDRTQRAHDCANRDLGLEPYVCGGRCETANCEKAYSSEALLREHLASIEERNMQCPRCGRTVLKKNIARHMQKACPQHAQSS
ncbi:hypothetical protein M408DRAFT_26002 [Serendipita vermifera MAFF 305830]|uniref:C2H2-type domain-containing protein n=1 Tax=Serendipita vermifera MAFF 305830 TaxID=933852 RepID=A0A0C2X8Z6_SERVB|nr:hypothetical protein M408DRAFT_26002 [Serendipita vermifera MAFF 305830]